jgi:integrase
MLEVDPDTTLSPLRSFFWDRKHYPEGSVRKIATTTERIIRQANKAFVLRDEFPNPDPTLPNDLPYSRSFFQKQFLTEAELHEIIGLLKDRWKDLAILMAYSGLDLAEAIHLTWDHIDKKNNMIVRERDKIRNNKKKKKIVTRRIPIRGELEKMLRRRFKDRKLGDEKIFHFVAEKCADPRKDGKALKWTNRMFQWDWKHAQEKSSVEWNVRVKDLRHFFGSSMLNRGVDSLEIANQMGHQDLNMLRERYGHYTDEKLHNSSKVWDYSEVNKS